MDLIDTKRVIAGVVMALALAACGGGGGDDAATVVTPPAPAPTGLWVQGQPGEGLARFAAAVNGIPVLEETETPQFSPGLAGVDGGSSASTTYTLEADIDEHDIVKYHNQLLAVAPGFDPCCYLFAPASNANSIFYVDEAVRLYRTDPVAGTATPVAAIPVDDLTAIEGLYLDDQRLQLVSSSAQWGAWGSDLFVPPYWQDQEVGLSTFDVTDAENPGLVSELSIEGALLLSRRQDGVIHLVTRHTPAIEGLIYYPQTDAQRQANQEKLDSLTEEDLLPTVLRDGLAVTLPGVETCYRTDPDHPLALDELIEVSLTLMLTVSATTGEVRDSACVLDPVGGVAMTEDSLVFTYVDFAREPAKTLVHSLAVEGWRYRGSAEVEGALYTGGNADFRINQYEGAIRLVTTARTGDVDDRLDHYLFVLEPDAQQPELNIIGELPRAGGEEIGKPNEDLYGVRFFGDRAYMVTFERVDPLYVIDLSDPENPSLDGVLEVPGFSDLLHPVSDDLLLGVGVGETPHAKVELFDIRDTQSPSSLGTVDFLTPYTRSSSPAQFNRYTFTYLAGSSEDRFTLPVSAWSENGAGFESTERVMLLSVVDKSTPAAAGLIPQGEIDLSDFSWISDQTRTVIDGEALFVIAQGQVFAGFWSNPESVQPVSLN